MRTSLQTLFFPTSRYWLDSPRRTTDTGMNSLVSADRVASSRSPSCLRAAPTASALADRDDATFCIPMARMKATLNGRPTLQVAAARLWFTKSIATSPTPPEAACIRTDRLAVITIDFANPSCTVQKRMGSVLASSKESESGVFTCNRASVRTFEARQPSAIPKSESPQPMNPARPPAVAIAAHSRPIGRRVPVGSKPIIFKTSRKLRPVACTSRSTCKRLDDGGRGGCSTTTRLWMSPSVCSCT